MTGPIHQNALAAQSELTLFACARAGWNAEAAPDGGSSYRGVEATLDYIDGIVEAEGGFDGVCGFSQGGSLAHLLLMRDPSRFRFAVIIGARLSRDPRHRELVDGARASPLQVPSLCVWGTEDDSVPPGLTQDLASTLCVSTRTTCAVAGGKHRVPTLGAAQLELCSEWFAAQRAALAAPAAPAPRL